MLYLGQIRTYNKADHTASVTLSDAQTDLTIPIPHNIQWWECTIGAHAVVAMPDDTEPSTACVIAVYHPDRQPPLDPHFDPSIGHTHTGAEDDAPTLP
jgi:hypothetical protein